MYSFVMCVVFFFKQKTAYELRISDWSSDVCSSDLIEGSCFHPNMTCRCSLADVDVGEPLQDYIDRPHERPIERTVRDLANDPINRPSHYTAGRQHEPIDEIGRAPCRERGCQTVYISVGAVSLKKKNYQRITKVKQ